MDICRRKFGFVALGGLAARALALPSRPKLLVLLVLEQFRPDYLSAAWAQLGPGGFRKILEKGAYFPDCRHAASTFSASVIATLATGAWPAQHGIVADSWYDRASRKPVVATDEALVATTLATQTVGEHSRVFVIADSGAHAGVFAGTPDARLFWVDEGGQFATRGNAPDWLASYNLQHSAERWRGAKWQPAGAKSDAPAFRVLAYDQNHPGGFMALYRSSPFAQSAQFDFLNQCIERERLGQGDSFDFVCVISGAMAQLGYEFGARSPLMQDMVLRLDRNLEALLPQLARAAGENGFNLVFAGGHGAPPQPSPETRQRKAVSGESVAQSITRALSANGMGAVEKYIYPFLYLDTGGWRDPEPLRLAAGRAALDYPAVANFYTAGGASSTRDAWERRFRNSFHPKRSGDVMLSYRPEYVEDYEPHRGISYGSLYDYDVRVPLCFYGPQFRAGVFESPVESVDLAPTLARAIGVAPPSSAIGRVLGEALAE
jgi:predicted AlkP superfamily pyrophosphatase or phosphodiesterase